MAAAVDAAVVAPLLTRTSREEAAEHGRAVSAAHEAAVAKESERQKIRWKAVQLSDWMKGKNRRKRTWDEQMLKRAQKELAAGKKRAELAEKMKHDVARMRKKVSLASSLPCWLL